MYQFRGAFISIMIYQFQTTDDGKIFRCEYSSNAYTDEDVRTGVNTDTINITVQGTCIFHIYMILSLEEFLKLVLYRDGAI